MVKKKHYTAEEFISLARTLHENNDPSTDNAILRKLQSVLELTERPALRPWQLDTICGYVTSMITCRPKTVGSNQIRAAQVLGELGGDCAKAFLEERLKTERNDALSNAIRAALQTIKEKGGRNGTSKQTV